MKNPVFITSLMAVLAFCALGYLYLDAPIATLFYKTKPIPAVFEFITAFGVSTWYLISFATIFIFFRYFAKIEERANAFLYLFWAVAGSGIVADILKFILGRARPELYFSEQIYGAKFIGLYALYFSFPSGHAATAFSLATAIAFFKPKFTVFLYSTAALIAFSRIAIGAHYMSDVVAGAYIGVVFALWLKASMESRGYRF
ncbi:MAG TPA: phosphatase PAP2 family protein [Campylobacterales bacterium]|nr:phosphatase PAP2 family protein [Campylobacterales bacterium]